jgi:hypothetical protein
MKNLQHEINKAAERFAELCRASRLRIDPHPSIFGFHACHCSLFVLTCGIPAGWFAMIAAHYNHLVPGAQDQPNRRNAGGVSSPVVRPIGGWVARDSSWCNDEGELTCRTRDVSATPRIGCHVRFFFCNFTAEQLCNVWARVMRRRPFKPI